jgi:(S)-ureidoglycine aminohydrolase
VIEKPYQALEGFAPGGALQGKEREIASVPLMGDPDVEVRGLIPADPSFDLAVNTMTFQPAPRCRWWSLM